MGTGNEPAVMLAAPDGVIWIVIVLASIIAQIVKAVRQNKQPVGSPAPLTPRRNLGENDAPSELRQFLEGLKEQVEEAQGPIVQSVPPPVPAPQRQARIPSVQQVRVAQPKRVAPRPPPVPAPPATTAIPVTAPMLATAPVIPCVDRHGYAYQPHDHPTGTKPLPGVQRHAIRDLLMKNPDLRRPVVLREVLGSPIALRAVPQPDYK